MDFPLILVLATFASGVIWAIDALFFASKRRQRALAAGGAAELQSSHERREPVVVEYARSFFPVLLLVLVLRSFIFEPFRIPSGSMMPTLLVGDFILVSKFSYGIRLPVVHTKIVDLGEPQRGDIAVFRYPRNPSQDYIKRIVGLPGDRIMYANKMLFVNGVAQPLEVRGYYTPEGGEPEMDLQRVAEKLGDVEHDVLISLRNRNSLIEGEWVVPQGHYFAMGDNRDNSNDSRFWGFVPEQNLVGKAVMIWFNWDMDGGGIQIGRVGAIE